MPSLVDRGHVTQTMMPQNGEEEEGFVFIRVKNDAVCE